MATPPRAPAKGSRSPRQKERSWAEEAAARCPRAPGLSSSDEENVTRSPDNTQTVTGTQQFTIKSHQPCKDTGFFQECKIRLVFENQIRGITILTKVKEKTIPAS